MGTIKRGLVVSGGGSWGAFGAGTLAGLDKEYDVAAGISTGALMTPLALLGEHEILKKAYTNTTPKDIFDLKWYKPNPINKRGKINMWAIIYALIFGNTSLATTNAMRKHIDKFMKINDYKRLIMNGKEILVGCQNYQEEPSLVHFFSNLTEKFEDFCLSDDTKILTKRGFIGIDDIKEDDDVVSWKKNEMVYEKPLRIIKNNYSGKMLHFDGDSFECLVTPEHKMGFYKNHSKKTETGRKRIWKWHEKQAKELLNVGMGSIKYNYKFPVSGHINQIDFDIKDDEIRFVGWMVTEGWKSIQKDKYVRYGIGQSIKVYPEKAEEIENILINLNISHSFYDREDGVRIFQFKTRNNKYVESLLIDGMRRLPRKYLSEFSERQLEILFKSMMDGDGCWSRMTYCSNHYDLICDMQELCHKIGRVGKIKKGKDINHYYLYIMRKDVERAIRKINEIDYSGKTWCVTVPSGFITIKYKDKISVVGNCDWMWFSANYTFACSLIQKEWTPDPLFPNNVYMGQWADGGITEVIPLDSIMKKGCTEIDVIIHRPIPVQKYQTRKIKNLIEYVLSGIAAMRHDIEFENLYDTCQHMADKHGVTTTLYFLPRKLGNNSLVFNKEEMEKWWEEGYDTSTDPNRIIKFEPK